MCRICLHGIPERGRFPKSVELAQSPKKCGASSVHFLFATVLPRLRKASNKLKTGSLSQSNAVTSKARIILRVSYEDHYLGDVSILNLGKTSSRVQSYPPGNSHSKMGRTCSKIMAILCSPEKRQYLYNKYSAFASGFSGLKFSTLCHSPAQTSKASNKLKTESLSQSNAVTSKARIILRVSHLVAQCCPFALFGCIPLFA